MSDIVRREKQTGEFIYSQARKKKYPRTHVRTHEVEAGEAKRKNVCEDA